MAQSVDALTYDLVLSLFGCSPYVLSGLSSEEQQTYDLLATTVSGCQIRIAEPALTNYRLLGGEGTCSTEKQHAPGAGTSV